MAFHPVPAVTRRLMREISELKTNPPEGIRLQTNEDNMFDLTGIIQGPEGTPYSGGYFRVKFKFTSEFPSAPPKCWFATKIFHPNVSSAGEICVNTLKKDWQPSYGIGHILVTVKCLLIYPNPESALDEEAGKLLLEDYQSYCSRARLITSVHATPRVRPVEFDTPEQEEKMPSTSKPPSSSDPTPQTPTVSLTVTPARKPSSASNLKSSPASDEKDASHPVPLGTADSNVGCKTVNVTKSMEGASSSAGATKPLKRTAGGATTTGAEKRKKALKRL